jgi:hypothetical protein
MTGATTRESSRDPVAAVHVMLRATHERNAAAPLHRPTNGAFPSAIRVRPRPVVLDTHWLAKDVHYACVHETRTTLVTAANQQAVRIFCAQHVIDEVLRRHELWSVGHARAPVSAEVFLHRWREGYLPLIRTVPDDGIPLEWLSHAEQQRLGVATASGSADVPSIKLVLALRALYVSKDVRALEAAYGDASLVEHEEWLEHLRAGGDAAELMRMLNFAGVLGELSGIGLYNGARRVQDALGPLGLALLALAGVVAWQWVRDPGRQGLRDGVLRLGECALAMYANQQEAEQKLDRALPAAPAWSDLARTTDRDSLIGRACLYTLAREPQGEMSAQELAERVSWHVECTAARVRALLRTASCFDAVSRGRWQAGALAPASQFVLTPTLRR